MDQIIVSPKISIQQLKGLNEREQFSNPDLGQFDWLKGFVPTTKNTLTRAEGCRLYETLAEPVFGLCQTFDSRKNIIIQGENNVYIISEAEFFDQVYNPSLTPSVIVTSEDMSYARLVHRETVNTAGGACGTAWVARPLTHIVSQINPDGSAATFVTLVANQFTLAMGVYRILGGFILASNLTTSGARVGRVRLFNVTSGLPAWSGASNAEGDSIHISDAKVNVPCTFGGHLNLAGPTVFEVQDICSAVVGIIRGNASNLGTFENYGWIDIWKSA